MSIEKWKVLVLDSDQNVALKALQSQLREQDRNESQIRISCILPEIQVPIVHKAALIYLGYLGYNSENVVSQLKAIATLPISIDSMGVHVMLANLGDAKSSEAVREILISENAFLNRLLSDCIAACSVLGNAGSSQSLIEILLAGSVSSHRDKSQQEPEP